MRIVIALLLALVPLVFSGEVGKQEFMSSLAQFAKDREEAVTVDLGRLTDGRDRRDVSQSSLGLPHKRAIGPIKANTIRLNRPDGLPFSNGTGRVEVYHNAKWGTVCDRDWDLQDAQVVCSELGMVKAIHESRKAKYGEGVGPVWLSGMQCKGNEMSLFGCKHDGWGQASGCSHKDDAGVKCLHTAVPSIIEVGCFKDKVEPRRALRTLIANLRSEIDWYNVRSMVTKCAERAQQGGYKYFGIQFYGECWADVEGESRHDMYGLVNPQHSTQKCFEGVGMHWSNFVYKFASWKDMGCWRDYEQARTMEKLLVNLRYKIDWFNMRKTVDDCYKAAKKEGYKYFSIQFYGECWVSNSESNYREHGPATSCWSGVGMRITNYVYGVL